ncbi:MAG: TadE family protein, partial [Candidatus Dormibacteraceae bacterium]
AMVEFAMVIGIFLLVLFGAISAAFYALERSAGVTAVAAGVRAAAAASHTDPNLPDLNAADPEIHRVTDRAMFGTTVQVIHLNPGDSCTPPQPAQNGQVVTCVQRVPAQPGGPLDMISVRMVGKPRSLVSLPMLGLMEWKMDVEARIHQVTFTS